MTGKINEGDLLVVAKAAFEWIDAVPSEVVASLPTMPGIDRDWANTIMDAASAGGDHAADECKMLKISDLIEQMQSIRDRFGDTCLYIRRGGLSWGATALNYRDDDKKHGVFDLQASHDRECIRHAGQVERLKAGRDEAWQKIQQNDQRISELLRFNNEFEERARVAERQNKALRVTMRKAGEFIADPTSHDHAAAARRSEMLALIKGAIEGYSFGGQLSHQNAVELLQEVLRLRKSAVSDETGRGCDCGPTCQDVGGGRCRYEHNSVANSAGLKSRTARSEQGGRGADLTPQGATASNVSTAALSAAPVGEPKPVTDLVDDLAKWLHDETAHPESYPDHTWPETDRDDGRRSGGWVKIVPLHAQEYFRDIARRLDTRYRPRYAAPVAQEPVANTWFTDRTLPVMAMSGDIESDRVLKLHFRRKVTDQDRLDLTDALNLKIKAMTTPPAPAASVGAEEIARLVKAAEAFRIAMIESGATAKVKQNLYFDQLRSLETEIVSANALLSKR